MDFAFELMDRIGARLSGSPNLDRAVSWAVDRLTQVGLDDVRRDRWGEFGMAWCQRSTWVTLDEPDRASLPATAVPCDCASFEEAGIPPPLLVQDPLDFPSRTLHTSADTADHLIPDDLRQAAVVVATVLYNTAQRDERLPRK